MDNLEIHQLNTIVQGLQKALKCHLHICSTLNIKKL